VLASQEGRARIQLPFGLVNPESGVFFSIRLHASR